MRVAVTGATGFIGGAVADHLAALGHEVLALGRRPRPSEFPHRYAAWDLSDDDAPPTGIETCEGVVHAAAQVAPWGPDAVFREATVAGTERLLGAVDPAARLIVIGSASVYDPRLPHILVGEQDAPVSAERYLNAYGRAKADQERLALSRRPDALVLRPRAVWGPGDTNLLPRVMTRVRAGRLILPEGGRFIQSTTHVSSLSEAVVAGLTNRDIAGPVNIADATPRAIARLFEAMFEALGISVRIVGVPTRIAAAAAGVTEGAWRILRLQSEPPLTRYAVAALSRPFTLDLRRLHDELGIRPDVDITSAARLVATEIIRGGAGA
jgi:nucleoside-diphosphate-sugar epimerase